MTLVTKNGLAGKASPEVAGAKGSRLSLGARPGRLLLLSHYDLRLRSFEDLAFDHALGVSQELRIVH